MEKNYLKDLIDRNPGCYEKQLVLGMLHSQSLFKQASQFVCLLNPKDKTYPHDFVTRRYNYLFPVIASIWQIFGNNTVSFKIPKEMLRAHLEADAQTGILSMQMEVARELLEEIDSLYPADEPSQELLANLLGDGFAYWLDCRIARKAADTMFNASRAEVLTTSTLQGLLDKFKAGKANLKSHSVSGASILKSKVKVRPFITAISLPKTMKMMGGGFVRGDSTMIAGTNGGGKTVLGAQLARDFILQGIKVAYVTTEQRPIDMTARILTNHLKVNYSVFTNRPEIENANPDEVFEVDMIPRALTEDPNYQDGLQKISESFEHLQFIDWSEGGGLTVTGNLSADLEKLANVGFVPQVVIFDWIGSALDSAVGLNKFQERKDLYLQAADYLINYGKQKNIVVIIMVQFNKVKATNKEKPDLTMIGECTAMANNITNFIGISALMDTGPNSTAVFRTKQNLFLAKARNGAGGLVSFNRDFHIQTLSEIRIAT